MIINEYDISGIPHRPERPRDTGLTLMLDKGLAPAQVENLLEMAGEFIDLVKLGWGTALISPKLKRKLAIYKAASIPVYFGGTLFEAMYLRDQIDTYRRILDDLGIKHVEISNGCLPLSDTQKAECIEQLAGDFRVLSEVGSKDSETITPPYKWVDQIKSDLQAGSWKIICEARESGTAGVFRPNGEIRSGLIDEIASLVDVNDIIFEAPQKAQQVWFIRQFGPNVSLGNIAPEEVIPLETLRLGLRGDTLFEFFPEGPVPTVPSE